MMKSRFFYSIAALSPLSPGDISGQPASSLQPEQEAGRRLPK